MDFVLPDHTVGLVDELRRWARDRPIFEVSDADDATGWKQLVEFGIFDLEAHGGDMLDLVCAISAVSRAPLPGPLVEAELAARANPTVAPDVLGRGGVISSIGPGGPARRVVGWGARAEAVVSTVDGAVLTDRPCEPVHNAYHLPHGWLEHDGQGADEMASRRWLLASAATLGLASGAYEMTMRHTKDREVFGRPLASRQAVQVRLAECSMLLQGAEVAVLDAAWRWSGDDVRSPTAAALTWLYTREATEKVLAHAHQLFGALGFCDETGLVRLSSQARWLRLSVPEGPAVDHVVSTRARAAGTPPSLVLRGFR
ncbi:MULTISPECIES: acyl-CoA dehydrogenase family protein [Gordonia]|uniref:Acyl-CoA dehydrogenase/oxidase C-terminal domain-containing protein n=1 Tax=Gordonia alkanivorans CGMCC 6845 TaxID=1423140 RepID=W9D964_9ACTN|nr:MULTISPECIES: acyl-CoA dehydrogenase family protein [Gordonia]ETA04882.1 hypothetical protein V525_21390 [Gordonia alkanivorans CGMCC 6845]MDH3008781.1 acyl-CoA dehydrogenase family protein [Gordonia alkanivorans]MDH3012604.1 acyl-CoA dehydrogenase family protein [Gordonia alkanivorans]MDH3022000.1 acyl-CoA dehydrogenase family protein [Gordonia alkanivorans]MDH3043020.1 acyl-CoA dehydrogenase family protein [Gordonia alkanivorans]